MHSVDYMYAYYALSQDVRLSVCLLVCHDPV